MHKKGTVKGSSQWIYFHGGKVGGLSKYFVVYSDKI